MKKELKSIKFKSQDTVEAGLKRMSIKSEQYQKLITESVSLSDKKRGMVVKGLINISPDLKSHNHILTIARKMHNPSFRHEIVKAYHETDKKMEMITGLSTMTTSDAALFFRDYFDVGGTTADVTKWIANISTVYINKKRQGKVNPDYDGFWDDAWDFVCETVDTIGGAISSVVDAVVEAGKAFADIVTDIIDYTQNRINDIIEALLDAGREIGEFITGVIEAAGSAIVEGLTKVFKAILKAGKFIVDILQVLYDSAVGFIKDGIQVLIKIGCRIRDILSSALDIALSLVKDAIGFLLELGHSVWYILKWAVKKSYEVIKATFEKLLEIGKSIADLIAWCARRTLEVIKKGFQVLLDLGNTFLVIIKTLITDPRNVFKKAFQALKELGASIYDFVKSTLTLGLDIMERTFKTLKEIGFALVDFLEYALSQGLDIFKEVVVWLLGVGVIVFDILIWAIDKSVEIFGWALEAIDIVVDSFFDIVEWILTDIGGEWIGNLAKWLAEKGRAAIEWFKNKVIQPILAVGKLIFVIILASNDIVFLAIAYYILKALVDENLTDYKNWPATFNEFKNMFRSKIAILPEVDSTHKYVIVSDAHKESKNDVDSGIGHFYKNKELFRTILGNYASDESWTVIAAGDDEEFWYSGDISAQSDMIDKVQPIIDNNQVIFDLLSNDFYKNQTPRRFYKIRGNHDDIWNKVSAVNKLEDNGFNNIEIYDYATFKRNGKDTLVMHGQQYDPYNCDRNNFFGKFASNFVGESIDELNDVLVDIFGEGARIEGWSLAPFYERSEWESNIDENCGNPELSSGAMFDERVIVNTVRNYDCNLILGHTHDAKLMKDSQNLQRFYANSGTCGWWEDCVWSVEVTSDDVFIKAWTPENTVTPFRSFALTTANSF
ncbi:MAG: hypothetical protein ABR936_15395 [Bacteroidota bacterium]|jgi:predicted phosphodiesterase